MSLNSIELIREDINGLYILSLHTYQREVFYICEAIFESYDKVGEVSMYRFIHTRVGPSIQALSWRFIAHKHHSTREGHRTEQCEEIYHSQNTTWSAAVPNYHTPTPSHLTPLSPFPSNLSPSYPPHYTPRP
jgi:hypothetical protein